MTHAERAERRKAIADECRTQCLEDVARRHGVNLGTAREACRQWEVLFKRRRIRRAEAAEDGKFLFAVLRDLLDGGWGLSEIADRQGTTPQRISQIETMALEADLLSPRGAKASG
ncbi:hypothetical protein LCGC14_1557750 [marine sediment metagenome]|uniref:HTH cro/C1-type domain-containing protein n=1 Tax=marine sediment metagenome TaxID=412755 RepID=A0A0F9LPC5_9ZZZZ